MTDPSKLTDWALLTYAGDLEQRIEVARGELAVARDTVNDAKDRIVELAHLLNTANTEVVGRGLTRFVEFHNE